MRIIVSDTSWLIDLRRGSLLEAFLQLPYEFAIPDVLFNEELLSFSRQEKALLKKNMELASLAPEGVERVFSLRASFPALSVYDGFAYVVAEERPGSILLTGDKLLRRLAEEEQMEVHGVLWVVDELGRHRKATRAARLGVLRMWQENPSCRLPRITLGRMIADLESD